MRKKNPNFRWVKRLDLSFFFFFYWFFISQLQSFVSGGVNAGIIYLLKLEYNWTHATSALLKQSIILKDLKDFFKADECHGVHLMTYNLSCQAQWYFPSFVARNSFTTYKSFTSTLMYNLNSLCYVEICQLTQLHKTDARMEIFFHNSCIFTLNTEVLIFKTLNIWSDE